MPFAIRRSRGIRFLHLTDDSQLQRLCHSTSPIRDLPMPARAASRGLPAGEIPGGAGDVAAHLCSAERRGSQLAADARRQSGQVAPGAHHLVLRDVSSVAIRARLPALSSGVSQSVSIPTTTPWATGRLRALRHILSRPSLDEVHAYRAYVDDAMVHVLTPSCRLSWSRWLTLGINHEQQHQELIVTDVKNGLWTNPLRPAFHPAQDSRRATRRLLVPAAGVAQLRRRHLQRWF